MLLNSVILVLREVLEAAMVVSLFMAFTTVSQQSRRFLIKAILLGLIAGATYAYFLPEVSNWLEGVGQEITNTAIHIGIYCCLTVFLWLISRDINLPNQLVKGMMMTAIILAISRESAEIMLYISGFRSDHFLMQSVLSGSLIGLGIGVSCGIFLYHLMIALKPAAAAKCICILVVIVGSSMMSQATQFLIQADWLASSNPVWDSSHLISEHSLPGQLLYALMAYEATPTWSQILVYLTSLLLMLIVIVSGRFSRSIQHD
ncbi:MULTISPECIES: FTR1 family protein [unclassified Methylophaga]|jgi:high-affinity iron transporter|uniref:FTR1 family protein n=2 Tax=Methylophaga TaxID=40222 RepID=UPI000C98A879|nr:MULTISPECIES: FTR1 family protein [unclassified Methylophaga]MAK65481.1 iron permease [Methylophaga sp.]MAY16204.1 iron permease [Methylophaga sp.]HAO23985.1 iron permease [Methylophaga sp.]HCD06465.1 iron permease [Methylophaga sp.]|tara:strand:- start:5381 stop:6160 length:780 start_codon:yes stop_codon:yes gene_type:complete